MLLLDTHVWLWFSQDDPRIHGSPCIARIRNAARENRVGVAATSLWELAMLEAKGRVSLDRDCLDWLRAALSPRGVTLVPLTPEIAVESARLPGHLPGDPADRIIVATARVLDGTLVTADEALLEYARSGHLDVVPV